MRFNIKRRVTILACAVATAILSVELSVTSKAAYATITDVSCTGPYTANYNPGLTLQEKDTTVTRNSTLTTCLPLLTNPAITSGSSNSTVTISASCSLASTPATTITYYWNNSSLYSTIDFDIPIQTKPLGQTVFTSNGVVKDGLFKGDKAVRTLTLVTLDSAECLDPNGTGVTSATGFETLTLTR